jgi:hypothetical protein
MENGLTPIEIKDLGAGIQNKSSDLAIEGEFLRFPLTDLTYNWSFGKRTGLTTRYGIMPFPGHNSKDNSGETTIATATYSLTGKKPVSLIGAEDIWYAAHPSFFDSYRNSYDVYQNRKSVLGAFILPQAVQPLTNTADYPVLYWATIRDRQRSTLAAAWQYDLVPSTVWASTTNLDGQEMISQYEATVGGGSAVIPNTTLIIPIVAGTENDVAAFGRLTAKALTTDLFRLRRVTATKWYGIFAEHTYSYGFGLQSFVGNLATEQLIGANPRDLYYWGYGSFLPIIGKSNDQKTMSCSVTSVTGGTIDYQKWQGSMNLISGTAEKIADVVYQIGYAASAGVPAKTGGILWYGTPPSWTIVKAGVAGLIYAAEHCETSAYAVSLQPKLIASVIDGKPVIAMFNKYLSDKMETLSSTEDVNSSTSQCGRSNDYLIWDSPSINEYIPKEYKTKQTVDITLAYYENDVAADTAATRQYQKTCWIAAPIYIQGTAGTNLVADRGVLEAKKTYEYAYSIYNGITGVESNVGTPAKVYCDVAGKAIRIWTNYSAAFYIPVTAGTEFWAAAGAVNHQLPSLTAAMRKYICNSVDIPTTSSQFQLPLNLFAYRFYYREVGSYEWLFAGEKTFADVYFKADIGDILIGEANAIGLPGGQPGAYIDNSPLQNDTYLDVKSFAGKLWWVSKDAVRFSSANAFVYPIRNFIASSSGEFRGAIVHYFAGQAEARGRLVIFGNKATYDIRQTSEFQYTQVAVSATSQPQSVPIPDSNIIIAERSSHTAFSGRTAVIAEGSLYYWGATGIFRDDGVNLPERISDAIEPNLFDSYDNTKTDEFFAYYNKKSQEILFFYRPATGLTNNSTRAWVYSTRTEDWPQGIIGAWTKYEYKALIDWAQDLDLTKFYGARKTTGATIETPRGSGSRTLIGARANSSSSVSRPYFHDELCDCGDMGPSQEMMVKTISRIDATTVRFTLTTDSVNPAFIVLPGESVYVFASVEYGKMTINFDGLRLVKAAGFMTIDIYDISAFAGTTTLSMRSYFPVFISYLHTITCNLDTNFFAPFGVTKWMRFRYSHLLIQPVSRKSGTVDAIASITWNCNHTIGSTASKTIKPEALNTRERTTQIVFDMQSPAMQSEGQGIQLSVSYSQYGPRWTIFSWTLWCAPSEGVRNLLTYQQ